MGAASRWIMLVFVIGASALAPASVAQASGTCPDYLFIGARGSGESKASMGAAVEAEWKALQTDLGGSASISAKSLKYPARPVVHQ